MIYGPTIKDTVNETRRVCIIREDDEEENLEKFNCKVQKINSSDEIGCGDDKKLISDEEQLSYHILEKTTTKIDSGYECGMWKKYKIKLPNNFCNAVKRFKGI